MNALESASPTILVRSVSTPSDAIMVSFWPVARTASPRSVAKNQISKSAAATSNTSAIGIVVYTLSCRLKPKRFSPSTVSLNTVGVFSSGTLALPITRRLML